MSIAAYLDRALWGDDGAGPRCARLRKRLEDAIDEDLLPPEGPLFAEREIAALTGLSRATLRRAIQELAEERRVVQRQGSGSFMRGRGKVEKRRTRLSSFTEDRTGRGLATTAAWLERGLFPPAQDEIATLRLAPGVAVARVARWRPIDGRPMAIERAALPPDPPPNPVAVASALNDVLAAGGNRPVRAVERVTAINLRAADADLLGVREDAAGLHVERRASLAGGRVVEFERSLYRGCACDLLAELRLDGARDTS